jgi:Tfp pilus assembly PilM family ATPase
LIKDGFSSNPILIVEITENKTNFVVHFKNSVVDSTTIPISSNLFTEILAKSLNVSKKEAEDLKKTYGLGEKLEIELKPEKPAIFSSLVGPLVDLAEQIKNFIIYYQSHDSQAIKKILLAGKEANLKGLKEFLKKELNLEVELGNPFVNLPSLERDFPEEKFLEISSLLGLAMRAI